MAAQPTSDPRDPSDPSATRPPEEQSRGRWYLTDAQRQILIEALRYPAKMTYEEFLDWADEDTLAEWVNGGIVMTSPASLRHQEIVMLLGSMLRSYTTRHQLGRIVVAPFQMKLEQSGREPDVIFVATAHLDRLKPTYLDGPADLAVEVLSPESVGRDRGDKFYEYERAGIPEYWLIDPITERAEFYQLDEHGRYQVIAPNAEGIYHAKMVPGLWLRVAWLWQDPPPLAEDALREIEG